MATLFIQEIPTPSNLPAWIAVLLAIAGLAIFAARLAVTNYFEERKKQFEIEQERRKAELHSENQRRQAEIEIEFAQKRALLEDDRANSELIATAMSNMNQFGETIRNITQLNYDLQVQAARERTNITTLLSDQNTNLTAVNEKLNEVDSNVKTILEKLTETPDVEMISNMRIVHEKVIQMHDQLGRYLENSNMPANVANHSDRDVDTS